MKSYPLTIIDDFFVDPDYIRNLALSVDYPHSDQRWPGRRSEQIYKIDRMLFDYVGNKILSIFGDKPEAWDMAMNFQKIVPFSDKHFAKSFAIKMKGCCRRSHRSFSFCKDCLIIRKIRYTRTSNLLQIRWNRHVSNIHQQIK